MARPKSEKTLLVQAYLDKGNYESKRGLATLIYKENKHLYDSVEQVRGIIRERTGTKGTGKRACKKSAHWNPSSAKILILDIETAPLMARVWDIWNQNINTENIHSDWFCLTWAAKWLFENKVYSAKVTPTEARDQNDKRIMQGIWGLLNEADLVIAHNGDKFDLPRLNTRFLIHGLTPPSPYQSIDTLKHIRKQFAFTSNKLDYVNKMLHIKRKTETGLQLWIDCFNGHRASLLKMENYNINDVRILEETYLRIRGWIKPHPNINLFMTDGEHCPNCGHDKLTQQGSYATASNTYVAYRCNNCGGVSRSTKADKRDKKLFKQSIAK